MNNQWLSKRTSGYLVALAVSGVCSNTAFASVGLALEEVVVTAQKRAQSMQAVPISVSPVSGERIAETGIVGFEDMSTYVPNFSVTKDPIGDKINIRGIQSGNQAGFEQSVGTFVDGIYRGRGQQARFAFMDVEMVEVLRGPQGTLFGKNTVAGALNIRSAKPTDEFEAEISAAYNIDFDETNIQAYVSGPLTDSLRARVALLSRDMDEGWMHNRFNDSDDPHTENLAGRISLEWDAMADTTISFKYENADYEVGALPHDVLEAGPQAALGVTGGKDFTSFITNSLDPFGSDPTGIMDFGSSNRIDGHFEEAALTSETNFANGSVLTAIIGYSAYDFERFLDADYGPLNALRFDDTEDFDQSSVELRLASDTGGAFEYIGGLFYQQQNLTVDGLSYFNLGTLDSVLGNCGGANPEAIYTAGGSAAQAVGCATGIAVHNVVGMGLNGVNRYAYLDQDTASWAVFGQGTWNLSETLRLTAGIRYTEEKKEASQGVWTADFGERNTLESNDPVAVGTAQLLGEFTTHDFGSSAPGMTRDEESFTWSANLQWDVTPDAMLYATASTGFKAGGYNSFFMGTTDGVGADSNDADFDSEEVLAFELGSKMSLLDGAAELNFAVFRTEYDDLQAAIFSGNTTFEVKNAAEAVSQGIEIDGRWRATENLTLQGSLGWIDFEYQSFANQACTNDQLVAAREEIWQAAPEFAAAAAALGYNAANCANDGVNDLAGRTSESTPELSATLVVDYLRSFGEYDLRTLVDVNYLDKVYRQGDLDPRSLDDANVKVNMTVTFGPQDGQWDVSLIGKNLTDEFTYSYLNDVPLFSGAYNYLVDAPRSLTVRGRLSF